jgi:hypothetical protein
VVCDTSESREDIFSRGKAAILRGKAAIVKRTKMSLFAPGDVLFAPGDVLFAPEDVRFVSRKNLFLRLFLGQLTNSQRAFESKRGSHLSAIGRAFPNPDKQSRSERAFLNSKGPLNEQPSPLKRADERGFF